MPFHRNRTKEKVEFDIHVRSVSGLVSFSGKTVYIQWKRGGGRKQSGLTRRCLVSQDGVAAFDEHIVFAGTLFVDRTGAPDKKLLVLSVLSQGASSSSTLLGKAVVDVAGRAHTSKGQSQIIVFEAAAAAGKSKIALESTFVQRARADGADAGSDTEATEMESDALSEADGPLDELDAEDDEKEKKGAFSREKSKSGEAAGGGGGLLTRSSSRVIAVRPKSGKLTAEIQEQSSAHGELAMWQFIEREVVRAPLRADKSVTASSKAIGDIIASTRETSAVQQLCRSLAAAAESAAGITDRTAFWSAVALDLYPRIHTLLLATPAESKPSSKSSSSKSSSTSSSSSSGSGNSRDALGVAEASLKTVLFTLYQQASAGVLQRLRSCLVPLMFHAPPAPPLSAGSNAFVLLAPLRELQAAFTRYSVSTEFTAQVYAQLCRGVTAVCVNAALARPELCGPRHGLALAQEVGELNAWFGAQGKDVRKAAGEQLGGLLGIANVLSTNKSCFVDDGAAGAEGTLCPQLPVKLVRAVAAQCVDTPQKVAVALRNKNEAEGGRGVDTLDEGFVAQLDLDFALDE